MTQLVEPPDLGVVVPRSPLTGKVLRIIPKDEHGNPIVSRTMVIPFGEMVRYDTPRVVPDPAIRDAQDRRVDRLRRGLARLLREGRSRLREAASWLFDGVKPTARRAATWFAELRAARAYESQHAVQRHWFGRERSTAEHVAAFRRGARESLTEADLRPTDELYWVGWPLRLVELARGYDREKLTC